MRGCGRGAGWRAAVVMLLPLCLLGCRRSTPTMLLLDEATAETETRATCQRAGALYDASRQADGTRCDPSADCDELKALVASCRSGEDGVLSLRTFVDHFRRSMKFDSACHDIALVSLREAPASQKAGSWHVRFVYSLNHADQTWQLSQEGSKMTPMSGTGSAKEAAHAMCSIVQDRRAVTAP